MPTRRKGSPKLQSVEHTCALQSHPATPTSCWGGSPNTPHQVASHSDQHTGFLHHTVYSPAGTISEASSVSPTKHRGRFNTEELCCFRRVPTPSVHLASKLEAFPGKPKRLQKAGSDGALTTKVLEPLPVTGSALRSASDLQQHVQNEKLLQFPMEDQIANILDQIYPKKPSSPQEEMHVLTRPKKLLRHQSTCHLQETVDPPRPSQPDRPEASRASTHTKPDLVSPRSASLQHRPPVFNRQTSSDTGGRQVSNGPSDRLVWASHLHAFHGHHVTAQQRLLEFRTKIMDRFSTMRSAFDVFATGSSQKNGGLTRKEFGRFISRHFPGLSRQEQIQIFDFLDADKSGILTLEEFHIAIEAAGPVKSIQDLRRKWLSLGYPTIRQALLAMDLNKEPGRYYTLSEFSFLLAKTGIEDPTEQQNVYNEIVDPYNQRHGVTLEALGSALSAVSPSLLLEEIRDKLLKLFGNLNNAFLAIDTDQGDTVDVKEFLRFAVPIWKMTAFEAVKAFRLIDIDRSHKISRREFVRAMALSEPNLYFEETRRKVLQRFRSIRNAILPPGTRGEERIGSQYDSTSAGTPRDGREPKAPKLQPALSNLQERARAKARLRDSTLIMGSVLHALQHDAVDCEEIESKTPEEYKHLLSQVHLSDEETKILFDLVDINKDGKLTAAEFEISIRLFAPSCCLEDLRVNCIAKSGSVADAFANVPQDRREAVMTTETLQALLEEIGLYTGSVNVEMVIDIAESRQTGGLTVSELIAALRAGSVGTQVRLPPDQVDSRARQQIKWQMAPFHRSAAELRALVREKLPDDDHHGSICEVSSQVQTRPENTSEPKHHAEHKHHAERKRHPEHRKSRREQTLFFDPSLLEQAPTPTTSLRIDLQKEPRGFCLSNAPMNASYTKVTKYLLPLPECEQDPIIEKLQGYYTTAVSSLADHDPLISRPQSRLHQHRRCMNHYDALSRPAVRCTDL